MAGTRAAGSREPVGLTRDQVIAEALALMDEAGTGALTMRRLADRLGVHVSTLYWHVRNKEELHGACVRAVLERIDRPETDAAADWRPGVAACMRAIRTRLGAHPGVIELLGRTDPVRLSRLAGGVLAVLRAAGLGWPDAFLYTRLLIWDVVGFVEGERRLATASTLHEPELDDLGRPVAGRYRMKEPWPPGAPPEVRELSLEVDVEAMFEARVGLFVDGLAAVLARRS